MLIVAATNGYIFSSESKDRYFTSDSQRLLS